MASDKDSDLNGITSDTSSTEAVHSARRIRNAGQNIIRNAVYIAKECNKNPIVEFNSYFMKFIHTKAELTMDEMNRCLVKLGTSPNISQFEPEDVEVSTMFINVHKLISTIESRSSLLWSALSFIEQAAQNSSARSALVQKFKYMEILSKLLYNVDNQDRILRVLKIFETLTYGIIITWQEPYLKELVRILVNLITGENDVLVAPSLSILINLCYKNLPPIYLLLRCIEADEFLNKIESHGILACKMSLLLENNLSGVMETDFFAFVKFTFSEIHRAFRSFNLGVLRHTVDFFADMKANQAVCMHFENYGNFLEDVQSILQYTIGVDNRCDLDFAKEAKWVWSQCISILFEFLVNILHLKANVLKSIFPKMASCALLWIVSEKVGSQSLELLTTLINNDEDCRYLSSVYPELMKNVGNALTVMETINPTTNQVSAFLKLISVLLRERLVSDNFCQTIKSFLFESIFGKLPTQDVKKNNEMRIIPQSEISLYIHTLVILADLSSFSEDYSWKVELDGLMKLPVIQFVIAKAILCDDAGFNFLFSCLLLLALNFPIEVCSLVFQLAKVNTFPVREMSEKIVKQGPLLVARIGSPDSLQNRSSSLNSLPNNSSHFSTEQRVNELIEQVTAAQKSNQIDNILMSDIMELFEYKITMCTNEEKDLLSRLDECNAQVTSLSHKLILLSAEMSRYQSQNFSLQMNIDRLQEMVDGQIEDNKRLKKILDNYEMSAKEENLNQFQIITQIGLKDTEIRALNIQLLEATNRLKEREDELQRLQELISSERRQNNDLEQCIKDLEILRDELQIKIEQQEQSIRDNAEEIILLEKENSSLENQVKKAERALQDKTNLLEHYAQDLRDVEEMQTQVVSIMKRKNVPS